MIGKVEYFVPFQVDDSDKLDGSVDSDGHITTNASKTTSLIAASRRVAAKPDDDPGSADPRWFVDVIKTLRFQF